MFVYLQTITLYNNYVCKNIIKIIITYNQLLIFRGNVCVQIVKTC